MERGDESAHARTHLSRSRLDRVAAVPVGGLNIQTTPALHHGATIAMHKRFTPGATHAAFDRDRPMLTTLVPTMIQALIDHPRWPTTDLSSLKAISTGSTLVLQQVIAGAARGIPALQVYGFTETCPIAIYTKLGAILPVRERPACPAYAARWQSSTILATDCRQRPQARSWCENPTWSENTGAMDKQRARRCATVAIERATSDIAMGTDIFGSRIENAI